MCGIAGFCDFTSRSDDAILKNMTEGRQHTSPGQRPGRCPHQYLYLIDIKKQKGFMSDYFQTRAIVLNSYMLISDSFPVLLIREYCVC